MSSYVGEKRVNADAEYLSVRDASRITGLPVSTLRSKCRTGSIPHVVFGKAFFLHMPSFRAMLAAALREGSEI